MDILTLLSPSAFSVTLLFSILFFLLNFVAKENKEFFTFSLVFFVVSLYQLTVTMKPYYLNPPIEGFLPVLLSKTEYVALSLLIVVSAIFVNSLLRGELKRVVILVAPLSSLVLIILILLFANTVIPIIVLMAIYVFTIYFIFHLARPFLGGQRGILQRGNVIYALGSLFLLVSITANVLLDFGLSGALLLWIAPSGIIFWAMFGAMGVLIRWGESDEGPGYVTIRLSPTRRVRQKGRTLTINDRLTGLYNREFFDESLDDEVIDSIKKNRSLSLLMIEVDKFKEVNEEMGRVMGENILAEISNVIKGSGKGSDLPSRYSEDKFSIILPNTDLMEAKKVAERFRKIIEEMVFVAKGKPEFDATISIGVASLKGTDVVIDLTGRAEGALLMAREQGGNIVCMKD